MCVCGLGVYVWERDKEGCRFTILVSAYSQRTAQIKEVSLQLGKQAYKRTELTHSYCTWAKKYILKFSWSCSPAKQMWFQSHFQGGKTNLFLLSLADKKISENNIRDLGGDFLCARRRKRKPDKMVCFSKMWLSVHYTSCQF